MLDSSTDLKSMLSDPSLLQTQAFINNQWVDGENGATFAVSNPARGDVIAQVADLSRADLARAIDGAEAAQKKWAAQTAKERCNILRNWYNLMMEHQSDLAMILTAEMGKPLAEAIGESDEAYGYINQVRNRAGLAPIDATTPGTFVDKLLHERRVELAFENHRWPDLLRMNKAESVMSAQGKNINGRLLCAIPQRELDLNSNFYQNSGY